MGTLTNSFQPATMGQLKLIQKQPSAHSIGIAEQVMVSEDDGLGCMRGFAVAMACNFFFALTVAAGWGVWRLLH